MKLWSSRVSTSTASCTGVIRAFTAESLASIFESVDFAVAVSSARKSCSSLSTLSICVAATVCILSACARPSSSLATRAPSSPRTAVRIASTSSLMRSAKHLLCSSSLACKAGSSVLSRFSAPATEVESDCSALSAPLIRELRLPTIVENSSVSSVRNCPSSPVCRARSASMRSVILLRYSEISERKVSTSRPTRSLKLRRSNSDCLNALSSVACSASLPWRSSRDCCNCPARASSRCS
mmetsp:Transcript_29661/g.81636  ORF Transcript_29661/g.81636 Transcript_29661/m.81636 type:complete len:239 (-) Transcript_29661:790-1506(-)